ncbi:MAG: hypothetical protein HYY02_07940 [Chloroflexi bacterium]|nr:hypothetical protein [Chloroflexota bacterium]
MSATSRGIDPITATRRNHALEHATVTVLLERHGFTRSMAGRSNAKGFYIYGDVSAQELRSAADEGLARMRGGERSLAVSPFCGTNIAVTGILAGLATLAIVGGRRDRLQQAPNVILAGILAVLAGQPLGRLAQKYLTTSPEMSSMRIEGVSARGWGPFKSHWVATSQS